MKHLFGPVASRRLGHSLGIDLIPLKTCTLDCIYCECGETTLQTCEVKEYVPYFEIIREISEWVNNGGQADYITFAGSGEPTLHSRLGEIIDFIKTLTDIPVCVITNSTLLHIDKVRKQVMKADLVIPSLDAAGTGVYRRINRPLPEFEMKQVITGLKSLAAEYKGEIWLEIFLVAGVNDTDGSIERLSEIASEIGPKKIQINTAVRPTAVDSVKIVPQDKMQAIAEKFNPTAEIIAAYSEMEIEAEPVPCTPEMILELVNRRPCSLKDISVGLCVFEDEAKAMVIDLINQGAITTEMHHDLKYYIGVGQVRN